MLVHRDEEIRILSEKNEDGEDRQLGAQAGFTERTDPTPSWLACAQVPILPQSEARSGELFSFSILDNSTKWQQSTVTEKEELDRQKKAVAEYLFWLCVLIIICIYIITICITDNSV